MRRLAHVILAGVVAFVLVVSATLYSRTRSREVEVPVGPAPVKADLNVKEVRIEEEAGKVRWRVRDYPLSIHQYSRFAAHATQGTG